MRQTQRQRHHIGNGMKLHLRVRRMAGTTLRILTPRPGTDVRFATNRFHDTWHILSDGRGARLLSHLLWDLSYQRRPGTVALIDHPFLTTTPFEANRSDPILLVPRDISAVGHAIVEALVRSRHKLGRPDGTVRMHSWGLERPYEGPFWERDAETFRRQSGVLVLRATRRELQRLAHWFLDMPRGREDHEYFATHWRNHRVDGELQVFHDFRARVSDARWGRRSMGARKGFLTEREAEGVWRATYDRGEARR